MTPKTKFSTVSLIPGPLKTFILSEFRLLWTKLVSSDLQNEVIAKLCSRRQIAIRSAFKIWGTVPRWKIAKILCNYKISILRKKHFTRKNWKLANELCQIVWIKTICTSGLRYGVGQLDCGQQIWQKARLWVREKGQFICFRDFTHF